VQQIILPSLWPRKKNTRGGDENADSDDDLTPGDGELEPNATAERETQEPSRRARANSLKEVSGEDSLDARMAAEGAKMRAAETRSEREERVKNQQHRQDGVRRRPAHSKNASTEDFRIPGRFE
jgi:maintenance of morphology protein 1